MFPPCRATEGRPELLTFNTVRSDLSLKTGVWEHTLPNMLALEVLTPITYL